MSTSKLKLNPDKTEFILFCSKGQRDKLKVCFPTDILGSLLCLAKLVKTWVCGSILIFPFPNMFKVSAKVVLCNGGTPDVSGSFLLMMLLYLWPRVFSVVSWITVLHFLRVINPCILQCTQNSAAKILFNTNRYISITPVHKISIQNSHTCL